MVLLTMTDAIVAALKDQPLTQEATANDHDANPTSLAEPAQGKPIAHSQIIDLWKRLSTSEGTNTDYSLEKLLQGSQVYIPPPPPKPEPTPEFKALMARLRREEEARQYERMVTNPAPHMASFAERFPRASTRSFASVNQPMSKADLGDDDVTYADVNRQVLLIFNFLVSILGVAGTVWMAARWWSLPTRIFLTMGSSIVVGIAEVAVYSIFVWKMGDAKERQAAVKEVKEVVDTWVLGKGDEDGEGKRSVLLQSKEDDIDIGVRKRTAMGKVEDT